MRKFLANTAKVLAVIFVVLYLASNPAHAGNQIHGLFAWVGGFMRSLAVFVNHL